MSNPIEGIANFLGAVLEALNPTGCGGKYSIGELHCEDPDPTKVYEDAKVVAWDPNNPKNSSIFVCRGHTQLNHITCTDEYEIVEDITSCPEGFICQAGECVDEKGNPYQPPPQDGYICSDTDPENDPAKHGMVEFVNFETQKEFFRIDHCLDNYTVNQVDCAVESTLKTPTDSDYKWTVASCPPETICCSTNCISESSIKGTPPYTCTDTDPENDPFIKGSIILTDASGKVVFEKEDTCMGSSDKVFEMYCPNNFDSDDPCSWNDYSYHGVECPEDMICMDGICKEVEGQNSCTDSDEGKNLYEPGKVSGFINDNVFEKSDMCIFDTGYTLVEYFCEGNKYDHQYFVCPNGCDEEIGACIPPSDNKCYDDDLANDPYFMGTVILTNGFAQTDYCTSFSPGKVMQLDYNDDCTDFIGEEADCKPGETCTTGKCND